MKIFLLVLLISICYIIFYVLSNKIHINWNSFFRKGFKKQDNAFRSLLLRAVNSGKRENIQRHTFLNGL